jgi:hypothetical protein
MQSALIMQSILIIRAATHPVDLIGTHPGTPR